MLGIGVLCFGVPLQSGFALVQMLHRKLSRIVLRHQSEWTTARQSKHADVCRRGQFLSLIME
jgi:hypothetical protein